MVYGIPIVSYYFSTYPVLQIREFTVLFKSNKHQPQLSNQSHESSTNIKHSIEEDNLGNSKLNYMN
jgi:hypothetical protein